MTVVDPNQYCVLWKSATGSSHISDDLPLTEGMPPGDKWETWELEAATNYQRKILLPDVL